MNEAISSILIIKPSSLGDIVHTLPAATLIGEAYPKAKITWVINPEWAPLLRGNRSIDHVHIFSRGELAGFGVSRHLLPWLRETSRLRPDLALDFQGLLRSALIGTISHPAKFWGMSDAREGATFFYQETAQVDRRVHAVERYLKLVEALGIPITRPLRFPLPTGDSIPHFSEDDSFVLLHPFARGGRKSLSDLAVEEFCHALSPVRVVLVGKSKREIPVPENCVNLLNHTTILQLVHLIRRARFMISVDSGPMHIAAAISNRLVSIHTWSDPRKVGPYNEEAWIWKNGELLQVRDLPLPAPREKGRSFRPADVREVLALVRQYL